MCWASKFALRRRNVFSTLVTGVPRGHNWYIFACLGTFLHGSKAVGVRDKRYLDTIEYIDMEGTESLLFKSSKGQFIICVLLDIGITKTANTCHSAEVLVLNYNISKDNSERDRKETNMIKGSIFLH